MTKEDRDTWQSWLLDAIHKIRYQKQRPNVERVSACIRMHHPQYSNETVEEYLELAVSEGIVSKVLNKGLISYRDPGSAPGRGQKTLHITGDMDLCKMVLKCMRELEGDAAGGSPWIPLSRLEAHIREVYAVEESSSGVELGDLLLRGAKRGVSKGALSPSSDYSCFSLSGKAKKPSATSQGNPPQILTYVAYTAPTCCECLGSASSNPSGLPESLISCHTCGTSVHPSCRVYSTSLITHFINVGWTCDECKACLVCGASQKDEDLIICEYCDQGVHYSCLDPRPLKRPKVWDCDDCLIARGKLPNNNIRKMSNVLTSQITTPSLASLISGCVTTPILPPVSSGLMLPLIKVEGCNLKSQEERSPPLLSKSVSTSTDSVCSNNAAKRKKIDFDKYIDANKSNTSKKVALPHSSIEYSTDEKNLSTEDEDGFFTKSSFDKTEFVDQLSTNKASSCSSILLTSSLSLTKRHIRSRTKSLTTINNNSTSEDELEHERELVNMVNITPDIQSIEKCESPLISRNVSVEIKNPGFLNNKEHGVLNSSSFDSKISENKPKGLVDSLSKYFTPGVKRTSRASSNSHANSSFNKKLNRNNKKAKAIIDMKKNFSSSLFQSTTDEAVNFLGDRKRHASSSGQQVRQLYDGLSHLYSDCDSRLRHIPSTNYAEKRRKHIDEMDDSEDKIKCIDSLVSSEPIPANGSCPKIPSSKSSPRRISDSDPKSSKDCVVKETPLKSDGIKQHMKKDRKKNYSLPSGVTELDINLFTESQEAAKKSLHVQCYSRNLPGISELNFSNNSISPNVQIPLTQLPPLVSAGNSRSPLAIQFGEFEISTWYSSPYPQEYAR
uniref:Uncharacterized protein n=1 Tax=Lepeophtheirus salmonis TaxID=72036 RepID=A0A0K2TJ40_LEPSM